MPDKRLDTVDANTDSSALQASPNRSLPTEVEVHEDGKGTNDETNRKKVQTTYIKPDHWTRYVEAICGIALVLITAYYTRAAFRQAKASETAANAADSAASTASNTLLLTQRAYLAPGDPVELLGGWAVFRVPISNDGNIAATDISLRINFERLRPSGEVLEDRVMDIRMPPEIPAGKDTASFVISMPQMDAVTSNAVTSGKQALVVRGHLKYDSGFQRPRIEELVFDYYASQKKWVNSGGTSIDIWLNDAKQRDTNNLSH